MLSDKLFLNRSYLIEKYGYEDSKFIAIQGMPIHYRVLGKGPTLFLLHGVGASMHTWEPWVKFLKNYLQLILVDLPGFGLTGPHPKEDYSMKMYTRFIFEFMDKLGIDKFSIAGNSMGGEIAWKSAAKNPERIENLFLLNCSGYFPDKVLPLPFRLAALPFAKWVSDFALIPQVVRHNMHDIVSKKEIITDEVIDRHYELSRLKGNSRAFIIRAALFSKEPSVDISKITAKALLLWGKDDPWIPEKHYNYYLEKIPGSDGVLFPGIGHLPQEEIPEATFIEVLKQMKP